MFGLIGLHTIFIPLIGLPTRFSNQPALTLIPMQSKRSKISWTAASRSNRKRKFKSNNSSINFFFKQTINSQTRPARCHIQPKVAASSIVILFLFIIVNSTNDRHVHSRQWSAIQQQFGGNVCVWSIRSVLGWLGGTKPYHTTPTIP